MRWVPEDMHLVWRFNRGHTDALREIYEQHKHQLVHWPRRSSQVRNLCPEILEV